MIFPSQVFFLQLIAVFYKYFSFSFSKDTNCGMILWNVLPLYPNPFSCVHKQRKFSKIKKYEYYFSHPSWNICESILQYLTITTTFVDYQDSNPPLPNQKRFKYSNWHMKQKLAPVCCHLKNDKTKTNIWHIW